MFQESRGLLESIKDMGQQSDSIRDLIIYLSLVRSLLQEDSCKLILARGDRQSRDYWKFPSQPLPH